MKILNDQSAEILPELSLSALKVLYSITVLSLKGIPLQSIICLANQYLNSTLPIIARWPLAPGMAGNGEKHSVDKYLNIISQCQPKWAIQ